MAHMDREARLRLDVLSDEELAETLLTRTAHLDVTDPQEARTPARFVMTLRELTTPEPFNFTTFEATCDEMVIQRDIPFASLCRHHVLPFAGVAHVGYVPDGKIAGLSKLARTIRYCARALQTQEELTNQAADMLEENLKPRGVAVVLEAEHLCMTLRGVQAPGTVTYTASMRGVYADHAKTAKAEFMNRISK